MERGRGRKEERRKGRGREGIESQSTGCPPIHGLMNTKRGRNVTSALRLANLHSVIFVLKIVMEGWDYTVVNNGG